MWLLAELIRNGILISVENTKLWSLKQTHTKLKAQLTSKIWSEQISREGRRGIQLMKLHPELTYSGLGFTANIDHSLENLKQEKKSQRELTFDPRGFSELLSA